MIVSSKEYIVRLYKPGDEEGIVEVLKASFPEWRDTESPLDHWKWKYLDNPIGSHVVVADWKGKIVGVQHRLYVDIKIDEKTLSSCGDDEAVHPEYRRKGIYKNMLPYTEALLIKNKIELNYGVSIHEATVKMGDRVGYHLFPFQISHMLQVKNVGMHFRMRPTNNNLAARLGFSSLKLLNQIKNIPRNTKKEPNFQVVDIFQFDERINFFWRSIRKDYNFIIEKNMEYLNWRYCDPRSNLKGRYFIKQVEQDGEILGFIVIETRRKGGYSEGYIVDLLALPGRMDVARKLLEEACLFFRDSGINVVHYQVVKNHPYQVLFRRQGFIEVPSKLHFILKMFRDKEKMQIIKYSKPSQIHLNYGDYY
jgi:GNAT superfamily N-acetyltransferase